MNSNPGLRIGSRKSEISDRLGRNPALGFTLMELLVVIAIIALLMGVIVPTYDSVREHAKVTKAKVTAKNLETAFKAYLDCYHTWPAVLTDKPREIDSDVVDVLRKKTGGDNKKGYVFYEFETTNAIISAIDPFTNSRKPPKEKFYRVQVDDNYDNKIIVGGKEIYRTVIVWSIYTNTDDDLSVPATKEGYVKSWE